MILETYRTNKLPMTTETFLTQKKVAKTKGKLLLKELAKTNTDFNATDITFTVIHCSEDLKNTEYKDDTSTQATIEWEVEIKAIKGSNSHKVNVVGQDIYFYGQVLHSDTKEVIIEDFLSAVGNKLENLKRETGSKSKIKKLITQTMAKNLYTGEIVPSVMVKQITGLHKKPFKA